MPGGRGPLVVLNDEIHYAREAQKMNSTQLDTFKSPNRGRAGVMNTGKAYFFSTNTTRYGKRSEFSVDRVAVSDLPRVEIVYSYANLGRETIDFLVGQRVRGIVLAGVGDGNSTDDAIAALAEAAQERSRRGAFLADGQRPRRPQRRGRRRQARLHRRDGAFPAEGAYPPHARPDEDEGPEGPPTALHGVLTMKATSEIVKRFKADVGLFGVFTDERLRELVDSSAVVSFEANEVIAHRGAAPAHLASSRGQRDDVGGRPRRSAADAEPDGRRRDVRRGGPHDR